MSEVSEVSEITDWRKHFPYPNPRENQSEVLDLLAENWKEYDVFVLRAPTAFGKTAIAKTLMNALYSVSYITPTNQLVDQFLEEFPDTPTLSRLDKYWCEEWQRSCAQSRARNLGFCKGCDCSKALAKAKYRKGPGVYNYHIHNAHRVHRDVLIVDEAHNLIPYIRERQAIRLWQHDVGYPSDAHTREQLLEWFRKLPDNKKRLKKHKLLHENLVARNPNYIISRAMDSFNGKGTRRGEPEDRDCLRLLPVDISGAPKMFWPGEVGKVVLMSATIGPKDIETLGLSAFGRVCYINCRSPISPDLRSIISIPVVNVNRNNMIHSTEILARFIEDMLLPDHIGEKGVIHATYQMAELLQQYLSSDRFLFHNRENKAEAFDYFCESPPEEGKVLIACGMYEGIDLPHDLGRWQVVAKVPWLSLGDPAIKFLAERDPEYYLWETIKVIVQAAGRICRTPDDFGVTYILDQSFERLNEQGNHLIPEAFSEALQLHTWNTV